MAKQDDPKADQKSADEKAEQDRKSLELEEAKHVKAKPAKPDGDPKNPDPLPTAGSLVMFVYPYGANKGKPRPAQVTSADEAGKRLNLCVTLEPGDMAGQTHAFMPLVQFSHDPSKIGTWHFVPSK